jgi:hypothetical protein
MVSLPGRIGVARRVNARDVTALAKTFIRI